MREVVADRQVSIIYRVNAGVIPKESWIQDPQTGGGRIIGEVCHFIDTCSYLTQSYPLTVFARCVKKNDDSIPDEDNVSISLGFKNGSTAVINYTAYGSKQAEKECIEVFAPDTFMKMNDFRELKIYSGNRKEQMRSSNQDKGFKNELSTVIEAVKTGQAPISFESLYLTTSTTFKILESIKSGTVISI